jgi:hypothetical protein
MKVLRKVEALSRNHRCRGKAISITYSECVYVALVIQHAKRMRRIILTSVACLAVTYFSTYLIHSTIFGKTLLNIKCVFWFSVQLCMKHFSFWEEFSEMLSQICIVFTYSISYSCQILMKLESYRQILEKYSGIKFLENPSSGSWIVRRGQTNRYEDEDNSRFSQFCEDAWKLKHYFTILNTTMLRLLHHFSLLKTYSFSSDMFVRCRKYDWVYTHLETKTSVINAQVNRRNLNREFRARSQSSPCGNYGGQTGTGYRFLSKFFGSVLSLSFHQYSRSGLNFAASDT